MSLNESTYGADGHSQAHDGWQAWYRDYTAHIVSDPTLSPDESINLKDGATPTNEGVETETPRDPVEEAQAEAAQLKDKLMRTAADFDNYRKRSRREMVDAEKKGRDHLLKDFLPVFDNLERATSHAGSSELKDASTIKGLVDGIELVMRQFHDVLGRLGIERVESVGQPFDPSVHEAIQHLETSDFPPGSIAAEVQPGYKDGDRLLRPALVVVAKARSQNVVDADQSDQDSDNN